MRSHHFQEAPLSASMTWTKSQGLSGAPVNHSAPFQQMAWMGAITLQTQFCKGISSLGPDLLMRLNAPDMGQGPPADWLGPALLMS